MGGGRYASWGSRLGAILIDWIIGAVAGGLLAVILFAIAAALLSSASTADTGLLVLLGSYVLAPLIGSIVGFAFLVWQLCRTGEHNGQTFGKQALGIRIVRSDGRPVNFGTVFMRHILIGVINCVVIVVGVFLFDVAFTAVLFIALLAADYLWPLWDDRRQALHDKLANTFVVVVDQADLRPAPPPPARRVPDQY